MASSVTVGQYVLVFLIVCTVIFSCTSGEDNGCEGGVENGGYEGGDEDHGHNEGEGGAGAHHGNDPAHIVAGALLCFGEKHIYQRCDEWCRLSEKGDLHVPHDEIEGFCNGPCVEETNHVLECLEEIMGNFMFFNKATTRDVRDTISAACGHRLLHTDTGGDLDVGEHISEGGQESESNSIGIQSPELLTLFSFKLITLTCLLLLL